MVLYGNAGTMIKLVRNLPEPASLPALACRLGTPWASRDYRDLLQAAGMRQSLSRNGCCYDNAPLESFFHTLKVESVHRTRFETRDQARREVFACIETYYNRQRAHSAIGYITPEQAELRST